MSCKSEMGSWIWGVCTWKKGGVVEHVFCELGNTSALGNLVVLNKTTTHQMKRLKKGVDRDSLVVLSLSLCALGWEHPNWNGIDLWGSDVASLRSIWIIGSLNDRRGFCTGTQTQICG